jgi:adenylate cyclase
MALRKNIFIGLAVSVVFAIVYIAGVFNPLENRLYDLFLGFRSDRTHIDSVVFLDVDDTAVAYNGVFPWPRSIPADGLLRLKEYGTRAAIFDIEYIDNGPGVARENDLYLAQALALFGQSWLPLYLRESPLIGEPAERRLFAQERFSYPVKAANGAHRGAGFIDILPSLPSFAQAAKGSGFANIETDNDGLIRRVYLAQNVHDHWYLQLAFAPLMDYLGRPDIVLEKRKLTIQQARVLNKDITIPLDTKGRMLLDWPTTDYKDTFKHISFADFYLLAEIESELEKYSRALAAANLNFFIRFDSRLSGIPFILSDMQEFFDAAHIRKNNALKNSSETSVANALFNAYLEYRNLSYALMAELLAQKPAAVIQVLASRLSVQFPERAEMIENEAEYIVQLLNTLELNLKRWHELTESNDKILRDKFCIIGRVDTGTTEYGANPFYGKYANVGTHGVVLDTILSEAFMYPVGPWFNALFMLIFIPLFLLASIRLSPLKRFAAATAVTVLIVATAILLLRLANIFWPPTGIIFALLSALIICEIISYINYRKERKRLIGQRL